MKHSLKSLSLLLSIIMVVGYSCKEIDSSDNHAQINIFPLNIQQDSLLLLHPDCKSESTDECTYISYVNITVKTADDSTLQKITDEINDEIISLISENVSEKSFKNIDSIEKIYFDSWSLYAGKVKSEFPFPWSISLHKDEDATVDSLFSIALQIYSYSGGAHGNTYTKYLTFDLKSQELIDPLTRVDRKKFTGIAEELFRIAVNISPDADLDEAGFFFDEGRFHLSQEIGMNKEGYILFYNDYEIRPHADGPLRLLIPYTALNSSQ